VPGPERFEIGKVKEIRDVLAREPVLFQVGSADAQFLGDAAGDLPKPAVSVENDFRAWMGVAPGRLEDLLDII